MPPPKPAPAARADWDLVRMVAMDDANLPRALAGMGFTARCAVVPRGEVRWWPPEYRRHVPWRARLLAHTTAEARGLAAGAWPQDVVDRRDAEDARERERIAGINRLLRDSPVFLMHARNAPAERSLIAVDAGSLFGEWRSPDGAVRGDCLISLAQLMWGEPRFGRAGVRLARLCGLSRVPDAPAPIEAIGDGLRAAMEARAARERV